jgi:GAF domain-containing protein
VPLVVSGEAIGAIVVQDVEHEHRFNDNDQRMLTTLAGQVAATIYNVRLLEQTRRQAERDRQLNEVVAKIRSTTDMRTILSTTANELGKVLGLQRARIEVGITPSEPEAIPENGGPVAPNGDGQGNGSSHGGEL